MTTLCSRMFRQTDYARTLLTIGEIAVGMSPAAGISLFSRRDSLSADRPAARSAARSLRLPGGQAPGVLAFVAVDAGGCSGRCPSPGASPARRPRRKQCQPQRSKSPHPLLQRTNWSESSRLVPPTG